MAEKIYEERKTGYLILASVILLVGLFVLPNVYHVPCPSGGNQCYEPDSLFILVALKSCLGVAFLISALLYILDTKKYKIIGKKYLCKTPETKVKEMWKEVKNEKEKKKR